MSFLVVWFYIIYIYIVENHISRAFTTLERSFPDKLEEPSVCWLCNEHSWRAFFRGRDRKIAMFVRRRRGKFGKAVKHLWSVIFALTLHFLFFFRIYPKDTRMNRYIRWNNSFPYRIKYYIMGGGERSTVIPWKCFNLHYWFPYAHTCARDISIGIFDRLRQTSIRWNIVNWECRVYGMN